MRRVLQQREVQRGQAAVLVSLCLFSMVVFLAMATNMGILVNDRVRMQNAADLAAYAGAFEQARALNRMTWFNRRIMMVADDVRKHLTCKDMPDPSDIPTIESECDKSGLRVFPEIAILDEIPEIILQVADVRMQVLRAAFMVENYRAKETSHRAAEFTARANFKGTDRPRHASFYEWRPDSPTFRGTPLVQVETVTTQFTWATADFPCLGLFKNCISTHSASLETWFTKVNPGPTVFFPARLMGIPLKDFLDFNNRRGGYFGADAMPGLLRGSDDLWAFAVAKPFGGNLGPADDSNGKRKSLTFRWLLSKKTVKGYDYDSFEDEGTDEKFKEEYRARMAGVQDTMYIDEVSGKIPIKPIDFMMVDLERATHERPNKVRENMKH